MHFFGQLGVRYKQRKALFSEIKNSSTNIKTFGWPLLKRLKPVLAKKKCFSLGMTRY